MFERVYDISRPVADGPITPKYLLSAILTLVALFLVSGRLALAEEPMAERGYFDIPAQSLEAALKAFGAVTRLQVLYETSMTAGRRSAEVAGPLSHEAALRQLLSGTGLDFAYTDDRAFTLVYARQVLTRPISDFYPFLGDIQARIISALCHNSDTRPGAFRIAVQFRVNPNGRIENSTLLGSTGTSRRDTAIADVLNNLPTSAKPPADMPQPVTMVMQPGAPNGTDECPPEPRR